MRDDQDLVIPPAPATIHFVGIGGIGMSGLARIFAARGYRVTGSDAASSAMTEQLASEGMQVAIGHDRTDLAAAADLVVMTAAATGENPEVLAALRAGVPVVKRAVALGALANARRCIAVAGSHGKSTTSGMITTALVHLGQSPSYAVGAVVAATGTNAAPGAGEVMVVEADEFDRSFLTLTPDIAVITNVEYDHPDIYADQADYDDAYRDFISRMRPGATLVLCADDPGCRRVLERSDVRWPDHVLWYGVGEGATWRVVVGDDGATLVGPDGASTTYSVTVPGRHNLLNAAAAILAVHAAGVTLAAAADTVGTFAGIGRRFESKGCTENNVVVIDDYAHHPTEVAATLRGVRQRYAGRRLWVAFQPHTYSRTKALLEDWAPALAIADEVVLLDIYGSRETDELGVSSDDIAARMAHAPLRVGSPADAARVLAERVGDGDVVVTMGAGDITNAGPALLTLLSGRGRA
jgi:UDP-N-acetylmuramate--alanine ligase